MAMVLNQSQLVLSPELERYAELGHPESQYLVGLCFAEGRGTVRSLDKALLWYEKAVCVGHADAQYAAARLYERNKTEESFNKAFTLYRKAAEQGNIFACNKLARLYEDEASKEKSAEKARFWYEKALLTNVPDIDANDAYRKSITQLRAQSACALGAYLLQDDKYANAAELYQKALEFLPDYDDALYALAMLRLNEHIQQPDQNRAETWLARAAEHDYDRAQFEMGIRALAMRNFTNAAYWFKKAIANGNNDARFFLGCLYEQGGNEIQKNAADAIGLLRQAALKGSQEAQEHLIARGETVIRGLSSAPKFDGSKSIFKSILWGAHAPHKSLLKACSVLGNLAETGPTAECVSTTDVIAAYQRVLLYYKKARDGQEIARIEEIVASLTQLKSTDFTFSDLMRNTLGVGRSPNLLYWYAYTAGLVDIHCSSEGVIAVKKLALLPQQGLIIKAVLQSIAEEVKSEQLSPIFTEICYAIGILRDPAKPFVTELPAKLCIAQDFYINAFNCLYRVQPRSSELKNYDEAVIEILNLFDVDLKKGLITDAMLISSPLGSRENLRKFLTYGDTAMFKKQIISFAEILKMQLDELVRPAIFARWANVGACAPWQIELEIRDSFYQINCVYNRELGLDIQMRISLCLAQLKKQLLYWGKHPYNSDSMIAIDWGINYHCYIRRDVLVYVPYSSSRLQFLYDHYPSKDAMEHCTLPINRYTQTVIVDHILKEIKKRPQDSLLPSSVFEEFFARIGDGHKHLKEIYDKNKMITERGVQLILYNLGYLEE